MRVAFALFAFVRVNRVFRARAQKTRRGAHANAIIAFFVKKLRLPITAHCALSSESVSLLQLLRYVCSARMRYTSRAMPYTGAVGDYAREINEETDAQLAMPV